MQKQNAMPSHPITTYQLKNNRNTITQERIDEKIFALELHRVGV
jgi:hypothetical protein